MSGKPKLKLRHVLWLAVAAGIALALLSPIRSPDIDEAFLRLERARRLAYAKAGAPLPGTPDLSNLAARLAGAGHTLSAPILIRIFKREFELEVWKQREGRFQLFETYPICRWSGHLGPKLREGDRQAPEGFYWVNAAALNPNSRWHRSFNLGFPNSYDRAHDRTGTYLMVHGGCSSAGCFAMTNPVIDEIWQLVTAALKGGQKAFQVQVYPFRMSDMALERYRGHRHYAFWRDLKRGHDLFQQQALPPRVMLCSKRYEFAPAGHPGADAGSPTSASCSKEALDSSSSGMTHSALSGNL